MKNFAFRAFSIFISVVTLIVLFKGTALAASAHCDFNGDGFDDIAIGVPWENLAGTECSKCNAGAVHVLYGKSSGLSATNNQFWHKDSTSVLGQASRDDRFGEAVACGDFNGDGRDELAIGAPGSRVSGLSAAGTVSVLYGTASGLTATGNQLWSQDTPGVLGAAEQSQGFGYSLAAGDFNGDGRADLAMGSRSGGDTVNNTILGEVNVLYGSSSGLSTTGNQFWTRDHTGVGVADYFDGFGNSLVAADFGKDTASKCYDDLAIGAPAQDLYFNTESQAYAAGGVYVLYGSSSGLSASGSQFWSEDTSGILGTAEELDQFGYSLAAGTFRGSTSVCGTKKIADLAIGAYSKELGGALGGAVFVIYGTNSGLSATGNQMWTQASPGIADESEYQEGFGWALAAGHTASGHDYLAIGNPFESLIIAAGKQQQAGVVHVLYTDPSTNKLTASGSKFYHQNTPGIHDSVEYGDEFGRSLATGDFNRSGRDDLVISAPGESFTGALAAGAIHVLYGGDTTTVQFWHQNTTDIKDAAELQDYFGWALSP